MREKNPNASASSDVLEEVLAKPKKIGNSEVLSELLNAGQIREGLDKIIEEAKANSQGIDWVIPAGFDVPGSDLKMAGKTIEQVLQEIKDLTYTYEPDLGESISALELEKSAVMPEWLKDHEALMWSGASDNPLWLPAVEQKKDEIIISYRRRDSVLRPGKDAESQERKVEPLNNRLSLAEWKVIGKVLDNYLNMEEEMQNPEIDPQKRSESKAKFLAIISEENKYRHGRLKNDKDAEPQLLKNELQEAIDFVKKSNRTYKNEDYNLDDLTQKAADLLSQLVVLNRTRGDGRENIPTAKKLKDIREFPSFFKTLKDLANSFDKQAKEDKGISYLIGEAGVGKNIAAEYFAYKTNRPYFWFPCGRGMESMDLVHHYEFDSEEGTKRFMTDLARGIQTPGAVVLVDEVNALKMEVQAMLHGLGDSNRTLKYDGVNVPVAENVLILLASNPSTYGSAGNIGEALINRIGEKGIVVNYPALLKGEMEAEKNGWSQELLEEKEKEDNSLREYACNEILGFYDLLPEFKNISQGKFAELWEVYVNDHSEKNSVLQKESESEPALKELLDKKELVEKSLKDLKSILEIGDIWRKNYSQKDNGFNIVGFSLRDFISVIKTYADCRDVKKSFLQVYHYFAKNPIEGLDLQLVAIEELLDKQLV